VSTAHVLFESVAPIWVLWATAGAVLMVLARRARQVPGPGRVRDPEGGFDYTVNLVATLPALALLVCLAVETTMILTTKLGTAYAAYAAARSGLVWELHGPLETQRKAEQAAALAMAPFSSGLLGVNSQADDSAWQAASAYAAAYRAATQGPVAPSYLVAQYLRAARSTTVDLPEISGSSLNARVAYRYPFRFQIIGYLLADSVDPETGEWSRTIVTTVHLTPQEALDGPRPLGIPYQSEP
jgi:hypothetical protein